jgi:hypothetical protein
VATTTKSIGLAGFGAGGFRHMEAHFRRAAYPADPGCRPLDRLLTAGPARCIVLTFPIG